MLLWHFIPFIEILERQLGRIKVFSIFFYSCSFSIVVLKKDSIDEYFMLCICFRSLEAMVALIRGLDVVFRICCKAVFDNSVLSNV